MGGMEKNPYESPREKGAGHPRWTARTRLRIALALTCGMLTGAGLAVMASFSLGWRLNLALWAFIALGLLAAWFMPQRETTHE
jgi:uncharacterized membrane protein